jgi:hypothetical protein
MNWKFWPEIKHFANKAESSVAAIKLVDHRRCETIDVDAAIHDAVLLIRNIAHGVYQAWLLIDMGNEVGPVFHGKADNIIECGLIVEIDVGRVPTAADVGCVQTKVGLEGLAALSQDCASAEYGQVTQPVQGTGTKHVDPPHVVVLIAVRVANALLEDVEEVTMTNQLEWITQEDQVTAITDEKPALRLAPSHKLQHVIVPLKVWQDAWLSVKPADMAQPQAVWHRGV